MVKQIPETDIQRAKLWENSGFIEDDILLIDKMNEVPIPREPRRMNFIFIALCTQGRAQYRMDTQEKLVSPGQMIIVSERHVIDNYMASPDLEGLCMILSKDFYHEVIQNVSDISSLFIFSKTHPVFTLTSKDIKTYKEYFSLIKRKINDTENHFRKDLIRGQLSRRSSANSMLASRSPMLLPIESSTFFSSCPFNPDLHRLENRIYGRIGLAYRHRA